MHYYCDPFIHELEMPSSVQLQNLLERFSILKCRKNKTKVMTLASTKRGKVTIGVNNLV